MSKKMLINATLAEENRVAIVEDGLLTELDIEVAGREQTKGNIYKAVVVRVETGLQAAFVDYGAERLGFLQIDEINFKAVRPDFKPQEGRGRTRITDLLARGQEILVQITKEERGTKGAALTTFLSLAGRYMVLMPDSSTRGVSRKAENDTQRKELKKAMASLELPEKFGYIVRTAALDQTREELERDSRYLMRLYESICELQKSTKAPALIYRESNLVIRSIRDYFTSDMDEVLIDDPEVFREAKEFFKMLIPDQVGLVKLHQERRPIFSRYQIEEQIETISSNKVNLPSGGSIVIDSTEALVAIDINSGKMSSEQGVEETAAKTNLEAATEIGRQLRLRDLGGLIVIDFIDMRDRKNIRAVEQQLKKSTGQDKARINIGRISQFGLLEMSRQRIKATLAAATFRTCPHCQGLGRIKSPEALAVNLLRRIHTGIAKGQIGKVDARLPLDVASYLLNNKRDELHEMERRHHLQIHILGRPDFLTEQVEIDFQKREKPPEAQNELATVGMLQSIVEESTTDKVLAEEIMAGPEPSEGETSQEENAVPKKRRRRRGRKKSGEAVATDQPTTEASRAEAVQEDVAEPKSLASEPSTEQAVLKEEATATELSKTKEPATDPASPPKRPRRRRGRKKTSDAPTAKATSSSDTTAAETISMVTETASPSDKPENPATPPSVNLTSEEMPAAEKAPKRKRAPRRKAKPVTPVVQERAGQDPDPVEPAPTASPELDDYSIEEGSREPASPRSRTSKSAAKQVSAPAEATLAAPSQETAELKSTALKIGEDGEQPKAADVKKKPRRTPTRRKPATTSADQVIAETTREKTSRPVASSEPAITEEKPKRRRTPRKKEAEEESLEE